ncbi:transmembrane channel-like protein 7 isoform X2 [Achroia grisella]|nr:transmembrane channel-like protein 7 isoform X2 [Achroia grisella]
MQIKAMPVPMMEKREMKARLQNATKLRLQGLEHLHWKQRKVWHRFRIRFGEIIGKLELWQSAMRKIEGNFGTGVVSYFLFIRWLLFLNIFVSIVVILFTILPTVLLNEEQDNCKDTDKNSTVCCSKAYLDRNSTDSSVILDVIQGTGWMERTILFYGVYSNQIYNYSLWDTLFYYNMPLAYILVPISWALFCLISVVRSAAKGLKEKLVESEGQFYKFCNLMFGGWDFCIHNEKSAKIKHKALFNEIKGSLQEQRFIEERQLRSKENRILIHFKRLFVHIIVSIILGASGYLIYKVYNYSLDQLNDMASQSDYAMSPNRTAQRLSFTQLSLDKSETLRKYKESFVGQLRVTLLEFLPFLCIVVLNIIVPEIFSYLVKFEYYTPATVLIATLLRTVILRLSSLFVLLSQIYMYTRENVFCSYNMKDQIGHECWETYVGQQLYKLTLTDLVVQFIITFLINFPRAFLARHTRNRFFKLIGEQEFYLPKHVLDIVYIQTIIWMGSFSCPFLPIIGAIFYILIFYIKMFTCLTNCTPSPVVYRASKSKSLFMYVLLFAFIVSIAPVAYSVAEIPPSRNCGPYRGYSTVWEYVVTTFNQFPDFFRKAIFLIGTSTFAVPAFAGLLLLLYYYWAVAKANRHMVTVLRNQLVLEGHDKQFLLDKLGEVIRQHQRKCDNRRNRPSLDDDSSSRQGSRLSA